jgi:hypothetical protein
MNDKPGPFVSYRDSVAGHYQDIHDLIATDFHAVLRAVRDECRSFCNDMGTVFDYPEEAEKLEVIADAIDKALENDAQKFINSLVSKDSNSVYDALENAATAGEVDEKQDWERGLSKWTFPDGSRILMEGADITVVAARR